MLSLSAWKKSAKLATHNQKTILLKRSWLIREKLFVEKQQHVVNNLIYSLSGGKNSVIG
jgi:hypothetical protein